MDGIDNGFNLDGDSAICDDCDDTNPNVQSTIACVYNGAICGTFNLCVESCEIPPAESCADNIDNNCDGNVNE